jgi:histidinol-phosphate aminotransferase
LKKSDILSLVKPNVRALNAYEAADIACRIKLDANENPYGFNVLKSIDTNRYPDPEAKALIKRAAKEFNVMPENILHGNGSDELIYYLMITFDGPVIYPTPTFSMYGIIAQALDKKRVEAPLDDAFDLDTTSMLKIMKRNVPGLIFLSSPNNPTGNCFSRERVLKILKQSKGFIIVDEAYLAFSETGGFVPFLKRHKNLFILKTLSKIGLAGLRVGFLIADSRVIQEVNKVRLPFNLSSVSQSVAGKVLEKRGLIKNYVKLTVSERKRLFREMKSIDNIEPYPSKANFILFKVHPLKTGASRGVKNSDTIYKGLIKKGILVRNMKGIVNECLRVTIGTVRENTIFLKALKQLLHNNTG